jgi:hypothetical protein
MEKYLIAGLLLYFLNSLYWVLFAHHNIQHINKILSQLNYGAKVQELNKQEVETTAQVVKLRQQTDTTAAIRAASKTEHIEMHNADNLGTDVILDGDL